MDPRFGSTAYTVRRKVLKLAGGAFHVYDATGTLVFYSRMKAFTLREDIRLYTGEDMQVELLRINARQIVDFAAAYDVTDASTGEKLGALKRRGWQSMVKDSWIIMDTEDREIGTVQEDSTALAIVRRFLGELGAALLAPQRYHFELGGRTVGTGQQNRNPFVYTVRLDFAPDTSSGLDRRLGVAIGLLLAAIEGKQG